MAQAGLWEPDSSWPALKIIRIVASGGIRRPYGVVWLDVPERSGGIGTRPRMRYRAAAPGRLASLPVPTFCYTVSDLL